MRVLDPLKLVTDPASSLRELNVSTLRDLSKKTLMQATVIPSYRKRQWNSTSSSQFETAKMTADTLDEMASVEVICSIVAKG